MVSLSKRKIVLTGAMGYLGRKVSRALAGNNIEFFGLDAVSAELTVDLTERGQVAKLRKMLRGAEVIHLAGNLPGTLRGNALYKKSLAMSENLVEIIEPERILVLSSTAVYPRKEMGKTLEPKPWEIYGSSKLRAEQIVTKGSQSWTIFRSGTMLDWSRRGGIKLLLQRAVSGRTVFFPEAGRVHHPFVATQDIVSAIMSWTKSPGKLDHGIFDLVAPQPKTVAELVTLTSERSPKIYDLPRCVNAVGRDDFPILGISKWHVGALHYNLRNFPHRNSDLVSTSMSEAFRSSFAYLR